MGLKTMKYDPSILIERIIDDLEAEMTIVNKFYEFDDCTIEVVARISQDFNYDNGDYFTPPSCDLYSRVADIDSIKEYSEFGEREMTDEEIYYIQKQLEV